MPPPSTSAALHLQVLREPFFVIQLGKGEELVPCIIQDLKNGKGGFFAVTRTKDEVSIVGEAYNSMPKKYEEQCAWKCIKVRGPMEHSLTGILVDLTTPLKTAKIPVFAMSTWNTDYILIPKEMVVDAVTTLERDGWVFVQGAGEGRVARL